MGVEEAPTIAQVWYLKNGNTAPANCDLAKKELEDQVAQATAARSAAVAAAGAGVGGAKPGTGGIKRNRQNTFASTSSLPSKKPCPVPSRLPENTSVESFRGNSRKQSACQFHLQ